MKLFLSSTYQDLIGHREAAARAIERLGQQGVRMEVFGARPVEATDACLQEISDSDGLVGIYAHRYGYVPHGHSKSITEQEVDYARENGKRTFCFVIDKEYPWPPKHVEADPGRTRLREFIQRLQGMIITDLFTTPEDLAFKIAASLGRFLLSSKVKQELEKIPEKSVSTELGLSQVAKRAARIANVINGASILLVNDNPGEMWRVIKILRDDLGLNVQVETSSEGALNALSDNYYNAVISDMQRGTVEDEGIKFLKKMTEQPLDSRVNPNTEDPMGRRAELNRAADPADSALSPHRIEPATVLVDIQAWPGNVSGFGKVGAMASLDIHCARRRLSRAGRDEETGSAAEQRN
jgi:hypothetical protein